MVTPAFFYSAHRPSALRKGMVEQPLRTARAAGDFLPEIWEFLRISELMLLDILSGRPANPDHAGKGHPEFGCFLYYLHYPPAALTAVVGSGTPLASALTRATHHAKPATTITRGYLETLGNTSLHRPAAQSGQAVRGPGPGSVQGVRGLLALLELIAAPGPAHHAFGVTPYVGALHGRAGQVCLGVVSGGCAGAGAAARSRQMQALGCDYLFHLGEASHMNGDGEHLRAWRPGSEPGRMFAINSGRAVGSGGEDYFRQVLGSDIFRHQNMTSYFAVHYGKWIILGLDTAYHARPGSLYTCGVLGEKQRQWLLKYRQSVGGFDGRKLLVMTHHEGQDFRGAQLGALHHELASALGRAPDVWYWRQYQGTVAYSSASAAGRQGVKARCMGHSLPLCALTPALVGPSGHPASSVDYYSAVAGQEPGRPEASTFATVELGEGGGIVERFYVPDHSNPVWQSVNGIRFV
jgi:hypothetical protein